MLELLYLEPDAVAARMQDLVPGIEGTLQDASSTGSNSKIQALQFLNSGG